MRNALAVLAAVAFVLLAVACGEKSEPEPVAPTTEAAGGGAGGGAPDKGSEEKQEGDGGSERKQPPIPLAVEVALSASSASACTEAMTERYVRTAYGDLQGCEAAIKRLPDFDVAVSDVEISGDSATAKARPDGGPNKGETIKVELVNEGGRWKVDSAISNAPPGP